MSFLSLLTQSSIKGGGVPLCSYALPEQSTLPLEVEWNFSWSFCILLFLFTSQATCSHLLPLSSPSRDLLRIGVTLAGHQKKILGSIQDMRLQMNQTLPVQVWSDRARTDAVQD